MKKKLSVFTLSALFAIIFNQFANSVNGKRTRMSILVSSNKKERLNID